MVPPLPTYTVVGVQVVTLSAGRRLGLSTVAGPGVMASVQSVRKVTESPDSRKER